MVARQDSSYARETMDRSATEVQLMMLRENAHDEQMIPEVLCLGRVYKPRNTGGCYAVDGDLVVKSCLNSQCWWSAEIESGVRIAPVPDDEGVGRDTARWKTLVNRSGCGGLPCR